MSRKTSIEETSVWQEIMDIVKKSKLKGMRRYSAILHTEKEDFPVWQILLLERVRDYTNKTSEVINLRIRMGLGDYIARLYPYRNNLEVTLRSSPVERETSSRNRSSSKIETIRYRAIFNPKNNPPVSAGDLEQASPDDMNVASVVEVDLELYDRSIEALRIATVDIGAIQRKTPQECLEAIIPMVCSNVLVEGKPSVDRFDVVEADNKEVITSAVIPHGYPVLSLPTFFQEKLTGVYGRGIGTFLQHYRGSRTLFVYPSIDHERFDTATKKAIFYIVPQERLPQLEKSYWEDGDTLKVVVTGARRYSDSAEINELNFGSGYRSADATAFMKKPVHVEADGTVKGMRANLNHEVVYKERNDGLNYAPVGKPTANTFSQRSTVLSLSMAQFDLVWENADTELIYPGMPCEVVYISQGKPISLKGCVTLLHSTSNGDNDQIFRTVARLALAVLPRKDTPDLPESGASYDKIHS